MNEGPTSARMTAAVYDCPRIVGRKVTETLRSRGHDVLFDGPLNRATARPDADIWVTKWTAVLNGDFLRDLHPRRGIITLSVGKEHIDPAALKELGLRIENCPTFSSNSVAEHAMALAMRSVILSPQLPPLSSGPLIFAGFSDEYAERAVAQILIRSRQLAQGIMRAREYDYRRHDSPWMNAELSHSRVLIVGSDRPSSTLSQILKFGFNCDLYGFRTGEGLAAYDVKSIGDFEFLDLGQTADYVFLCTDKLGRLDNNRCVESATLEKPAMPFMDSNVSVLGTGNIGSIIARMARLGFNCKVTTYNTSEAESMKRLGVRYVDARAEPVEKALTNANFIFIALPLTDKTRAMIGGNVISGLPASNMPRVLVNVTRDRIVDSEPVYELLCNGVLMAYATDVLPNDSILWQGGQPDDTTRKFVEHKFVVATPHEGDCSQRSLERLCNEVAEKLRVILNG